MIKVAIDRKLGIWVIFLEKIESTEWQPRCLIESTERQPPTCSNSKKKKKVIESVFALIVFNTQPD